MSGYRDDQGKPEMDLVPWDAVWGVAGIFTWACVEKKNPYPKNNWQQGMSFSRVFNSMMRHAMCLWVARMSGGSDYDSESKRHHADHMATNALMLAAYFKRPWLAHFDDRPTTPISGILDQLKDCTSCEGTKGYHRTPCAFFEVAAR